MKILMLTPYLPFPLFSGGQIRSYNLLKYLSKKHEVTLYSFIREEKEKDYIPKLKEFCADVQVFLKRPPWSPTSLTLSAISVYPLVVCMYLKKDLKDKIVRAIEREHFDLIHAETFYVMPNIPTTKIPIILVEQTIEYLVYQHYTENIRFIPAKWLMNFDVTKIHYWEKKFWHQATRVVAMSESDRLVMHKLVPGLSVDLVPNGVDTDFFNVRKQSYSQKTKTILFVGNFKWLQNREAVTILVEEIWPVIKKRLGNINLWIVGRFPTAKITSYSSKNIQISSNVEDIREAYKKSDILLAPIYGPGGTRYKILEAMATGLPVVSTSTGIEGLGAKHGREVLIGETPSDLAYESIRLLTNHALYNSLAEKGRKLVEDKFNWSRIGKSLDHIYQDAKNI